MRAAANVRRQRPPWLHGHVVPDEREVGDLVRQRRRQGKVQEDLRSLRLVLLFTTSATTTSTREAGLWWGRGGCGCCDALTCSHQPPAPGPDPRSSGVGPVYMTNREA
eukprot:scaffold120019_cov54-Phaeocystis_antarctica.AAC.2